MNRKKRIVIVGATSAIAEHCARLWVAEGAVELALLARDAGRAGRVADDLRVRSPQSLVTVLAAPFREPAEIAATVAAVAAGGAIDIVLIAHGALPDQQACQSDLDACAEALQVNGISPALYAEAFAGHLSAAGGGTLALIGSVAGDRGRKSNYVYGAAKGMLERYAEGLRHRCAGKGVRIVLIKPGPTDTPMTAHLKGQGARLAPVDEVARGIVAAIARGQATVYLPGKWKLIMAVIRHLPDVIFNRMDI